MRQKRAKTYRKLMSLYSLSFGFREPYQILVDADMCKTAVDFKVDLAKQLATVLQGNAKPMITQCCIEELYRLGTAGQPIVDLAKTFERRKCNHREPIATAECIKSVVGDSNIHRYAIASQSQPLRSQLRLVPGTPLVHVNRAVMVLEPPSDATLRFKAWNEEKALRASPFDVPGNANEPRSDIQPSKKRKGPKGPNPLSVKKKRPAAVQRIDQNEAKPKMGENDAGNTGEKRKRPGDDAQSSAEINKGHKRKRRKGATISLNR